jgi:hypothetical protein
MRPVGFEPIISAGERPQTYALDRAASGIGGAAYSEGNCKETLYINIDEILCISWRILQ